MTAAPLTIEAALFCRLLRRTRRYGLSLGQIQLLSAIMASERSTLSASQAGRVIGISAAGLTGIVDGLESAGHLRREHATSDRRRIWLHLTESGILAMTEILSA